MMDKVICVTPAKLNSESFESLLKQAKEKRITLQAVKKNLLASRSFSAPPQPLQKSARGLALHQASSTLHVPSIQKFTSALRNQTALSIQSKDKIQTSAIFAID
ncbi:MAG: hypothetical protein COV66_01185 [Nitrospinae bacterium CG11_big_fil_rev_8_21_14_0_20_45_15]|nr:MAG: hypothetical protein COV66_01185 [Nitrospinae bacterium CG11_big_fil_rev_8_21_14_0_20_45_15]